MKKKIKRSLEIIIGILLIITGVSLSLIPFLPGFPLVFTGIILISPQHGKKFLICLKNSWLAIWRGQFKKALKEFWKFLPPKEKVRKIVRKVKDKQNLLEKKLKKNGKRMSKKIKKNSRRFRKKLRLKK